MNKKLWKQIIGKLNSAEAKGKKEEEEKEGKKLPELAALVWRQLSDAWNNARGMLCWEQATQQQ